MSDWPPGTELLRHGFIPAVHWAQESAESLARRLAAWLDEVEASTPEVAETKHAAREWLQINHIVAKRAGVWEEVV